MASVITIAGEQLFAQKAQANEQLDIDTFIFANVPGQDPAAPINRAEGIPTAYIVHEQTVQQVGRINENVVVYSTVLGSTTGPFDFNWVGLYSSVNDRLVAINHVPTVTKTVTEEGAAGNTLNRNFGIEYSGIAELTGITVAPETWQLDFTARLTGMDRLTQQLAADMNGKDWFIGDGFKVEPRSTLNTFKVTAGAGYVSGLRVELAADHILTLTSYPQFVYVDAWFDGTSGSQWKGQTAFTVTDTEMDDYVDVTGKQHYVFKLAIVNAADEVVDLRPISFFEQINKEVTAISDKATTTLKAMGWKFPDDIEPYIKKAAEEGFKKLMLGKGIYKCSELSLTSAFQTMNIVGVGSGFAYTPQTVITPATEEQTDIFISQNNVGGVDNVKFKGIKFDGLETCGYGVRQLSGAGWEYEDLQATNFTEWALWAKQGLNKYNRLFIQGFNQGSGIAMYSDFFANQIETTGGAIGVRVMAGGGRLSDILSNSQSDCCIELSPLDSDTNHINTSITGLYVGEVFNASEKPIIRIKGLPSRRVTDVQLTNIHTVSAAATVGAVKHNWHIECEKADRVIINGWAALGIGDFETEDLYDAGGLKAIDSTVIIASATLHNLSRSPIVAIDSDVKISPAVNVTDWGGEFAEGIQKYAVYCNDNTSKINIAAGAEFINERVANAGIGYGASGANWAIGQIALKLAGTITENSFAFVTNPAPWSAVVYPFGSGGVGQIEMFGRRVTYTGTFESTGAGDYTFKTIFSSPVDQCYNVSIQQQGSGANATSGMIFANGANTGAVTSGNTNSAATLLNSFKTSGLNIQANIGSGYGPTTWRYQMTRML